MIPALIIFAVGLVLILPLGLWLRQREREAADEAERDLARLQRRHLALTTRMDEIARDVKVFYPTDPPPASNPHR